MLPFLLTCVLIPISTCCPVLGKSSGPICMSFIFKEPMTHQYVSEIMSSAFNSTRGVSFDWKTQFQLELFESPSVNCSIESAHFTRCDASAQNLTFTRNHLVSAAYFINLLSLTQYLSSSFYRSTPFPWDMAFPEKQLTGKRDADSFALRTYASICTSTS